MSRRIPIIAANWKMHTTAGTARELCRVLRERIDGLVGGRQGRERVAILGGFVVPSEPVWAIGTGIPASGSMANEAIGLIRGELAALYGRERGEGARLPDR